jgi:hypothetical protein
MSINTLALDAVANSSTTRQPPSKDDVLAGLSKYIPTESITLYVAAVSSLPALKDTRITPAVTF